MSTENTMKKNLKYFWHKKILRKKYFVKWGVHEAFVYEIPDRLPNDSLIKKI